jgi:hypothetical protein
MCRNIKPLFNFDPPTTHEEAHAAALQFVRKVSGMQKPATANVAAFDEAVQEIEDATMRLLIKLVTTAAPKDRAEWEERRREQNRRRFAV